MFNRVAVTLDTSPHAEHTLDFASRLVRPGEGRLDLLHIHEESRPGEELEALPIYGWEQIVEYDDEIDALALEEEVRQLRDMGERVTQRTGIASDVHVLRGDPRHELTSYARNTAPDLVVASARPNPAYLDRVSGSLVRRCGAPVLLLRGQVNPRPVRMERILVALDGSAFSASILPSVITLARATGAEISLLRAPGDRFTTMLHSEQDPQEYLTGLRAAFPNDVAPPNIRRPIHSDPAMAILREAQCGYDLIAMATHGWGGAREWVLGSITHKVMNATVLPVLAYHPNAVPAAMEPLVPA